MPPNCGVFFCFWRFGHRDPQFVVGDERDFHFVEAAGEQAERRRRDLELAADRPRLRRPWSRRAGSVRRRAGERDRVGAALSARAAGLSRRRRAATCVFEPAEDRPPFGVAAVDALEDRLGRDFRVRRVRVSPLAVAAFGFGRRSELEPSSLPPTSIAPVANSDQRGRRSATQPPTWASRRRFCEQRFGRGGLRRRRPASAARLRRRRGGGPGGGGVAAWRRAVELGERVPDLARTSSTLRPISAPMSS